MNYVKFTILSGVAVASIIVWSNAMAQTKADRCAAYAREATRATPTTTGPVRGAARGAVGGVIGGAIVGAPGTGAAIGAAVGATAGTARGAAQKSRSYQYYYDQCMQK